MAPPAYSRRVCRSPPGFLARRLHWRRAGGVCRSIVDSRPSVAQSGLITFPKRPGAATAPRRRDCPQPAQSGEQMLVRANEINYDYTNERVAAVGNVQIYFDGCDAGSRPGHLRPEDQAAARGRQRHG